VQYMFRRHLDMTPLQYLRRTRLHYAHADLLATEGGRGTVTAISARWGFANTGRFAILHREVYGQSPHVTLRN
jgi:AraC-like DNA-binding protein